MCAVAPECDTSVFAHAVWTTFATLIGDILSLHTRNRVLDAYYAALHAYDT
jgi:hypothetical protein